MEAILFLTLIILTIISIVYNKILTKKYKNELKNEELISSLSWSRMDLIKMTNLGEIDANSMFFKFIMSTTSYSIKGLYYYNTKSEALNNVDILKFTADYCLSPILKQEYKDLNYEQKEMFQKTASNVLNLYFETHYIEKLIFKVFCKNIKSFTLSIPKRVSKLIPEELKLSLKYAVEIENSLACYAC